MEPRQVFAYSLYIKGVFGKNRSVKFKGFPLIIDCDNKMTMNQLQPLLDDKINKLKPKSPAWFKLVEREETLEKLDGYEIRTAALYQGKILVEKTI